TNNKNVAMQGIHNHTCKSIYCIETYVYKSCIMEQRSPFSVNDEFGEGTLFQSNQNGTPNRNSRQILTCKPFLF
ncbi:hypothetical protein VIGAN_06117700, partial [Vigna angularis var. angularis]